MLRANSRARLLDQPGKISMIILRRMSLQFRTNVLAWMEQGAPDVLQGS